MAATAANPPFDLDRIANYLSLPQTILTQLATNEQVQPDTSVHHHLLVQLLAKVDERAKEDVDTGSDGGSTVNGMGASALRKELLEIKAERKVERVNYDDITHRLSTRVKALESQLALLKAKDENSKREIDKLQSESVLLHTQFSELNSAHAQAQTELEQLRRQLANTEIDRNESMILFEKKTEEAERQNEEYKSVARNLQDAKRENSMLQAQVQEAKASEMTIKFQHQSVEQELVLVRQQSEWLNKELSAKTEEFVKYRRDKSIEITKLQSDLDSAQSAAATAQTSANLATRRLEEQTLKYEDSLAKVKELSDRLVVEQEGFKTEMSAQQRLAGLWERTAKDNEARVHELEESLKNSDRNAAVQAEDFDERMEEARAETDRVTKMLEEAVKVNDKLMVELKGANEMLTEAGLRPGTPGSSNGPRGSVGVNGSSSVLSPSAVMASRFQKSGKTFTEVYSENVTLTQRNEELQAENGRLSGAMQHILLEIQERAPVMQEQRREYERVCAEAEEVSRQLTGAKEARDEIASQMHELKLQFQRIERENKAYQRETYDLGRQVQSLLRELETQRDPTFVDGELTITNPEDEYDRTETDVVITKQLIVFRSVRELQEQNQRLVRLTRELAKKMETEEEESRKLKEESETGNMAVEEASHAINMLREEVKAGKVKIESLTRERDMCRRMLTQTGRPDPLAGTPVKEIIGLSDPSTPGRNNSFGNISIASDSHLPQSATNAMVSTYERMLNELQSNFDTFRRETATDTRTLQTQLDNAQRETSDKRVQLAKALSQIDMLNERYQILAQNSEMQTKELQELRKRGTVLQDTIAKQDASARQLLEDLVAVKGKEDILRNELANLRAEKNMHEAMEKRILEENQSLVKERMHLNELVTNLQSMQNELERSESETTRRIQAHAEALERELKTVRARLAEESEASKSLILRKENDAKEYQAKIDKLSADYQQNRETLIVAQTNLEHTTARVEDLTKQLQVAEEKLVVYERKPTDGSSVQTREQQLETEIVSLRGELKSARAEADQLRGHADQFKAIAAANEEAVTQLTSTYDEYRAKTDAKIAEADGQVRSLNETVQELKSDLGKAMTDMTEMQDRMNEEREHWNRDRRRLEERVKELDTIEERANAAQAALQDDLRKQAAIAQEAQQKYEHELMLHATDVQALTKVKEELSKLRSKVNEFKSQAETAIANLRASEVSWENQKQLLERSLADMENKCKDLADQNNILHSQLENVSAQALKIQQRANAPLSFVTEGVESGTGTPSTDKSIEELRHVIRYVRREKEILAAQHELSMQETKRWKQQLDHTSRALDEARAMLTEERQREHEAIQSAAQHAELLEKINQLNILRESNATLRDENEKNTKRMQHLEEKLKATEAKVGPLTEETRNLKAELESREQELLTVEEDNKRWKTRTQQILQKYERIDPVELENLKVQVTTMKETLDKTTEEKDEALKKVQDLGKHAMYWKRQHAKEVEKREQSDAQLQQVQNEVAGLQNQTATSGGEVTALKDSLSNIEQELLKVQQELAQVRSEMVALQQQLQQALENCDQKDKDLTVLKDKNVRLLAHARKAKTLLEEKNALTTKLETRDQELEALKASVAQSAGGESNTVPEGSAATSAVNIEAVVKDRLAQAEAEYAKRQHTATEAAVAAKEAELMAKHKEELESQQKILEARNQARLSMLENKNRKLEEKIKASNPGGSAIVVATVAPVAAPTTPSFGLLANAPALVPSSVQSTIPVIVSPDVQTTTTSTPPAQEPSNTSASQPPIQTSASGSRPFALKRRRDDELAGSNAAVPQPAPSTGNAPTIPLKRRRPPIVSAHVAAATESAAAAPAVLAAASTPAPGAGPVLLKRRRPDELTTSVQIATAGAGILSAGQVESSSVELAVVEESGVVEVLSSQPNTTTTTATLEMPAIIVEQPAAPQTPQDDHAEEYDQGVGTEQAAADLELPHNKRRRHDEVVPAGPAGSPSAHGQPEQMPTPRDDTYFVEMPESAGGGAAGEEQVWAVTESAAAVGNDVTEQEEFVYVPSEQSEAEGYGTGADGGEGNGDQETINVEEY